MAAHDTGTPAAAHCAGHRVAPRSSRRAALGTLPDLDVVPINLLTDDPVARMTWHRSFSHSLFVLPVFAWALWAWLRTRGGRVSQAPARWFWAIQLVLVTHALLDAFTVYGTQLWWPLTPSPTMWSSVFIIDPLYTLWLLVACIAAWQLRERVAAQRVLVAALALSTGYLAFSLQAKATVDRDADLALARMGLADAPRFSVPMPFNTLLWRVVAMTPDGFVEGERSIIADRGPMVFRHYRHDADALRAVSDRPAVQRLAWFNRGFMKAEVRDGILVLSDLRMGSEPDYTFRFAVAERDGGGWRSIEPRQVEWPWDVEGRLAWMWRRIWVEPDVPANADRSALARRAG